MSTRRQLISGLGALAASALVGCGGGNDETIATTAPPTTRPSTTTTTPATTAPSTVPPTTAAPTTTLVETTTTVPAIPRHPLTGFVLNDPSEAITRPALAVKIDNAPDARPNHSGLAKADIVFEEIVEANITRFAAVFHSQGSDPVGPVRSGRTQDIDMLSSFNRPLFAWSGGNPGVTRRVYESQLISIGHQQQASSYYRGPGSSPNNLYSSTDRLWALTPFGHPGPPMQQFQYVMPGEVFVGQPVTAVDIKMRSIDVTWDWTEESGTFARSQEGSAHNDDVHGRITATNVVMLVCKYQPSQVDASSPEAQTVGNGPAYVISNGQQVGGRWSRDTNDTPIQIVDEAGAPISLQPGNTWVELVEAKPSFDEAVPFSDITFR